MARVGFVMPTIDEAGNRISTGQQARIFDDLACTAATVVTDDAAGGTTITQPITPTSGAFTSLAVTTAAVDTTITVASTTGFTVGQYIPIYDGTNTRWRFIRTILASPPRLTLEAAIGVIFSNTNTSVGHAAFLGIVAGFVPDTTFHYLQITDVASGIAGPGTLIPTMIGISSVSVLEEGAAAGTRSTINFIGAIATAIDNGGASRVDITFTGPRDPPDGTVGAPSHSFASDPDTGLYSVSANLFAAAAGGHDVLRFADVASAVDYMVITNSAAGTPGVVSLAAAGTDTNIILSLLAKGTDVTNSAIRLASNHLQYLEVTGAATGASGVNITTRGTDANIGLNITMKGTGSVNFTGGVGIALGGGAAPTFGTIGGSGPATAAQNSWMKVLITGVASYLPVWR